MGKCALDAYEIEGGFVETYVESIEFRRGPSRVNGNCQLGLFRDTAFVAESGLSKVRAFVSQDVKGLDGKYAEPADRVGQLQRAFHRIALIDVHRPPVQIGLERGFNLELLPVAAVCQDQIGSLQAQTAG